MTYFHHASSVIEDKQSGSVDEQRSTTFVLRAFDCTAQCGQRPVNRLGKARSRPISELNHNPWSVGLV